MKQVTTKHSIVITCPLGNPLRIFYTEPADVGYRGFVWLSDGGYGSTLKIKPEWIHELSKELHKAEGLGNV